jgi:hypothetical protein
MLIVVVVVVVVVVVLVVVVVVVVVMVVVIWRAGGACNSFPLCVPLPITSFPSLFFPPFLLILILLQVQDAIPSLFDKTPAQFFSQVRQVFIVSRFFPDSFCAFERLSPA